MLLTLPSAAILLLKLTGVHKMDILDDNFWDIVEERLREAEKLREKDENEDNRQRQAAVTAAVIAAVL